MSAQPPKRTGIEDAVAVLRALARDNWPGDVPASFRLTLRSGAVVEFPFPVECGPCSHSPDFSSIVWFGKSYGRFSPPQAAVLRLLWEAWEAGTPEVGGQYLLAEVESGGRKMSDLFGDHAVWKDGVINRAGKSAYRLYEPADP
jgi:hypothetical protein